MPEVTRYVALLRAINVGGHNVKMAELRTIFTALTLTNVETFIASGNVRFSCRTTDVAALETRIEARLRTELGYDVATFIRTDAEMIDAAAFTPFTTPGRTGASSSLSVGFLKTALPDATRDRVLALRGDDNDFVFRGREFYWWLVGRFSDSTITGAKLEKALGQPTTIRNVTTVRKLALLCSENA